MGTTMWKHLLWLLLLVCLLGSLGAGYYLLYHPESVTEVDERKPVETVTGRSTRTPVTS